MILLTILAIVLFIAATIALFVAGVAGTGVILAFGDVIIFVLIIMLIIKLIKKKK